jgi:RIO kinase 1
MLSQPITTTNAFFIKEIFHLFQQATLTSSLQAFYKEELITDVVRQVKSGKEASVYCCLGDTTHPLLLPEDRLLAAKVYRPAEQAGWGNDALRSGRQQGRFRNDAVYRAGQGFLKRRDRVAFEKKSRHGREIQFSSWLNREWESLEILHQSGADVPRPIWSSENAILMEYVGDEEDAAPALAHVDLEPDEAEAICRRVLKNLELFLACDRVHADLSAFNILYWEGEPKIIDLPQAVDADQNPNARMLLERDLANVAKYFGRHGIALDAERTASDLWTRYRRGWL